MDEHKRNLKIFRYFCVFFAQLIQSPKKYLAIIFSSKFVTFKIKVLVNFAECNSGVAFSFMK